MAGDIRGGDHQLRVTQQDNASYKGVEGPDDQDFRQLESGRFPERLKVRFTLQRENSPN